MEFKTFIENQYKLFGKDAQRITTNELKLVFYELKTLIGNSFPEMELTRWLPAKEDHGDIDILAHSRQTPVKDILAANLGNQLVKFSKNGNVNSFLFKSNLINKVVHVDLITSPPDLMDAKRNYYAFGDASFVIGVISKKLHFKYGTEGFFKRFKDQGTIWHDIPVTNNMKEAMLILGFSNPDQFNQIKTNDDTVAFIATNPFIDSSWFMHENLISKDKQSQNRRKGADYILDKLKSLNLKGKITDEDYFFKTLYPEKYKEVEEQKVALNQKAYVKASNYNGYWLMNKFGIKPGPQIGNILRLMTQKYGDQLDNVPEPEAIEFVKGIMK